MLYICNHAPQSTSVNLAGYQKYKQVLSEGGSLLVLKSRVQVFKPSQYLEY